MANAEAWITGDYPNQKLNLKLPTGATGPVGPVGPIGPASTVPGPANTLTVVDTVTGPETPGATGPQGVKGDKGDPGGIVQGAALGGSDLNLITTPGLYSQVTGANVTTLNNYPANAVGDAGVLLVTQWGGAGQVVQQYTTYGNPPTVSTYGVYIRTYRGSWTPWTYLPHSRVDQTAGRAIYQWDDLNNREQLIYGDTGVRRIETSLVNGWTGAIVSLRRTGPMVQLGIYSVVPTARTSDVAYALPSGFRPAGFGGNTGYPVRVGAGGVDWVTITGAGDVMPPVTQTSGTGIISLLTWTTVDPWPTTLPGTASGTIPNL